MYFGMELNFFEKYHSNRSYDKKITKIGLMLLIYHNPELPKVLSALYLCTAFLRGQAVSHLFNEV